MREVDDAIRARRFSDAAAWEVIAVWTKRRDHILGVVDRTEALGAELRRRALPLVLCHADLHKWNFVIDEAAGLCVID